MADIRINALATTAASTASDDFIAVDGSANGTRKLNAFSPTFGGNLTVSGGLLKLTDGTTFTANLKSGGSGVFLITGEPGTNTLAFGTGSTAEAARFAATTGNFLVGTPIDSSNGKLQLATHTTSAGGIGFGTDLSLYRSNSDALTSYSSGTVNNFFLRHSTTAAGGFQVQIDSSKDVYLFQRENRPMYIGTNNTTALTLDSSQNATFAGQIQGTLASASSNALLIAPTGGADRKLAAFQVLGTSNGVSIRYVSSTGKVVVNFTDLPTSSSGLSAGDIWNDSGTLKIV